MNRAFLVFVISYRYMNNPYHNRKNAEKYESGLNLPLVKTIRTQEAVAIYSLLEEKLTQADKVLDIGAGTGFYTLAMAELADTVLALEPSVEMSKQLLQKVENKKISNIQLVTEEFENFQTGQIFDYVVLIGVLDYIENWENFLQKCVALAKKGIIFSAPQRGLWSSIYILLAGLFEHIKIFSYTKNELQKFFGNHPVRFAEVGFENGLAKGMTLVGYADLSHNSL